MCSFQQILQGISKFMTQINFQDFFGKITVNEQGEVAGSRAFEFIDSQTSYL